MLRTLSGALVATLLCLGAAAPVAAASLGLAVNPAVGFFLTGSVGISDDGADLLIVNDTAAPLGGVGIPDVIDDAFDLFVVGDSLGVAAPAASLFVDGADGSLTGDLLDFAIMSDALELLFSVTQDDFGVFGARVLVVVRGDFANGLEALDASVAINPVAAIPLPASLPLLAGALMLAAAVRRRA